MPSTIAVKKDASARATLEARVDALGGALRASDARRRALHDELQELRGGVRVVARVRPGAGDAVSAVDGGTVVARGAARKGVDGSARPSAKLRVRVDRAFGPGASNNDVYEEVDALVTSALDGHARPRPNVSRFDRRLR